jgi:hypothetical protein
MSIIKLKIGKNFTDFFQQQCSCIFLLQLWLQLQPSLTYSLILLWTNKPNTEVHDGYPETQQMYMHVH